jgi:hypothetical protein
MNYKWYNFCNSKCYWCWACAETQYIDDDGKLKAGHHPNCKLQKQKQKQND